MLWAERQVRIMQKRMFSFCAALLLALSVFLGPVSSVSVYAADDTIVLRICNWEEYMDEGGWDEEEAIDLESETIFSEKGIISDFENWYYETYGKKVIVEYSTFGTNEELYSQLTLGDKFDLVCPSEYMIMKLMSEELLEPLSENFFDTENPDNYYTNGVSPYIRSVFEDNEIDGEAWAKYAAGYMWGITGIVYNPEYVTKEEASTWEILTDENFYRQVTAKDNVRDAYFPALGIINKEILMDKNFTESEDYHEKLATIMNDTDPDTIEKAEALLKDIRNNVYSFETDSGKADMVSGKVVANLQWSGDGVYTLDQAEEDDVYLNWAVPEECTNLWFDGWVMLKSGINGDAGQKHAAEAFINFISRPDNVVRNMYHIGYTSVISGGDSPLVFEYADWCYGAEEGEADTVEYPLGYFFSGNPEDEDYVITALSEQQDRQLAAQYPTDEVIRRSAVMQYFDDEANKNINQMWINVRCFNLGMISSKTWITVGIVAAVAAVIVLIIIFRHRIFRKR